MNKSPLNLSDTQRTALGDCVAYLLARLHQQGQKVTSAQELESEAAGNKVTVAAPTTKGQWTI
jgi:hypothetical protein